MARWFTVLVNGELRIAGEGDPEQIFDCDMFKDSEFIEDVELDVDPGPNAARKLGDGSTLSVYSITMRYAGRFSSAQGAEAAAMLAAEQMELLPLPLPLGVTSAKMVFLVHTTDSEDWDGPDPATDTLLSLLRERGSSSPAEEAKIAGVRTVNEPKNPRGETTEAAAGPVDPPE
jgi:hypothetical protein